MATQPETHSKFSKASGGRLEWYPVTANAVIRKGDLLKIASNRVAQAIALPSSDETAEGSGGNLDIAAFAEEDFTADAAGVSTDGQSRSKMLVRVVDDTFRWETRVHNSDEENALQQSAAIATAYRCQRWRNLSANEWWYEIAVEASPTNGEFVCVNRSPNSSLTDTYGINIFKPALASTVRQLA